MTRWEATAADDRTALLDTLREATADADVDVLGEGGRALAQAMYARHGQQPGGASPLQEAVVPTASQRQRRHREVGSEGSPRQNSDPRNTNRIRGWAAWMSRHGTAMSVTTKGLPGKCGGAGATAAVLIRGDLSGCRVSPTAIVARRAWTRQGSAAAIVPAGITIAGKGQTSVRGTTRTDSRSAHRPQPSHPHGGPDPEARG
jgi:hypothetical protein